MESLRFYGNPPYSIAILHGGPGAPGEMAPVARELASTFGILEPMQTAHSIHDQIAELRDILEKHATNPVTLIGWSWGAMLAFMFAAHNPACVKKLLLVSSGVFEEKYAENIQKIQMSRMSEEERTTFYDLQEKLKVPLTNDKKALFSQLGALISKVDSFDPIFHKTNELLDCQYELYLKVWSEAKELRKSGKLLALSKQIECPVTAIHGDFDPRPLEGIVTPLSSILKFFRHITLEKCGHHPWLEKHAREKFYQVLRHELSLE